MDNQMRRCAAARAPADPADQLLQSFLAARQPAPSLSAGMRRRVLEQAGDFGPALAIRIQRQAARMAEEQAARMARQFGRLGRRLQNQPYTL